MAPTGALALAATWSTLSTTADRVADAKADPGKLMIGSGPAWTYIAGMFKPQTGNDILYAPDQGAALATTD